MSDWQVGDLAVCVDASAMNCECGSIHLGGNAALGQSVRVTSIQMTRFCSLRPSIMWDGCPDGGAQARRFRKIRPDEQEACETEFVTLLKRSKRRVVA